MSLLEELKQKMNEAEQNYKQNKQNYEDAYNQINKKTDEVKRLVKENNKNNTCMQDVLAKIIYAEENYVAAQMAVIEAQKIYDIVEEKEALDCMLNAEIEYKIIFRSDEYQKQNPGWVKPVYDYGDPKPHNVVVEQSRTIDVYNKIKAMQKELKDSGEPDRINFLNERIASYGLMQNDLITTEATISYNTANKTLQVAKKIASDALQKYETEKLFFFNAHLTDTLSNAERKRSNFEMVEVMLKQINVLQNWMNETKMCEEKRVEEKRSEEKRAEEKRAEEKRAEEKQAEEKRITRACKFGFICAIFCIALTWFRNKDFEYPLIDVTPPVGYLGMQ
jgi:hypothetical protein